VSLTIAGRKDQDCLHFVRPWRRRGEANLMDISDRQSKVSRP
jgi:hypothetical protein